MNNSPRDNLRAIIGTRESTDNATIIKWADTIGTVFPEMRAYAHLMKDATEQAWCGFCQGYVHALAGIRPPFDPTDDKKSFMWAASWRDWGIPVDKAQPGDVLVLDHHVTLCDGERGNFYLGLGGNQSDKVKISEYAKDREDLTIRRPPTMSIAVPAQKIVPLANAKTGASNYDIALKRVLDDEGGYTNHPADRGGPTNYGITITDVRMYLNPNATARDVENLTLDQAKEIYRQHYWEPLQCDELPAGVDYCVFDYGVNSGISRSAKILQRQVGADVDGEIGPETIAHTASANPQSVINAMCDERMIFLKGLDNWSTFGKGWTRRVNGVRTTSLAMSEITKETPMTDTPAPVIVTAPATPTVLKSAHTVFYGILTAVFSWIGLVTLPEKLPSVSSGAVDQSTISAVVQSALNPQNASLILRDKPQLKAAVDVALLQAIQSGVPGQALQTGLNLVPVVGPTLSKLEEMLGPIIRKQITEALQQNQANTGSSPTPKPAPPKK